MDALERRRRQVRDALVDDPVVASLLLIHDLYPVPLEERVGAGARPRAAVHGVARRRRRAARASRTASRGCAWRAAAAPAGLVGDARARGEPGARGAAPDLEGMDVEGIEEPAGHRRRAADGRRVRERRSTARVARRAAAGRRAGGGAPSWFDVDGVAAWRPRSSSRRDVHGVAARDRERRRDAARLPQRAARAAAAASTAACSRRAR